MDYTVIGDTVNATSRLEYVAKQSGSDLIMSRSFALKLEDQEQLVCLGEFELRGYGQESVYGLRSHQEALGGGA